ncbi:MAG TPA: sugar phosphate nucleotidyltransferase, partial [archaeon]|nr:sugar phosphate nucleotidyltransferase [archaeon]
MKAVIMAGGEGTRLRPLTTTRPKPMVPVVNRPILEHVINLLKENGIDEVVITLQYIPEAVKNYFSDGSQLGMKITYSVEEKPLGTAGSVKKVEKNFKDIFLVISGDIITDIKLKDAVKFHKKHGAAATIVLTRVLNPIEYGIVITDNDGKIEKFLEKPSWGEVFSDTINAGIYILEPEVLKYIKPDEPFDFGKQLFPLLLKEKEPLYGYVAEGYWCDIGNPQQYAEANRDALSGKLRVKIPGKQIGDKVWIGEKTALEKGVEISGPVLIGDNCRIRTGARISESIIGNNTTVDTNTSVKRSVVWHNNFISSSADLAGCIICERCEVKSGATILENTIVGDDCSIGQGSVIRPMVKIWPNKMIEAGSIVSVDVRWGIRWLKNLFGSWGITALANIEVTPEFSSKLGAAFGSYLPKGAKVVVSRDTHNISRMVKRALISGLNSVGTNVFNLRVAPTPLTRFSVKNFGANAGISVKISHVDPNSVNIQFFDENGINIDKRSEKKIEELFFKEDFRRVYVDEIGEIVYPQYTPDDYIDSILKFVNKESIKNAKMSVVVDCNNGSASAIAPAIFH